MYVPGNSPDHVKKVLAWYLDFRVRGSVCTLFFFWAFCLFGLRAHLGSSLLGHLDIAVILQRMSTIEIELFDHKCVLESQCLKNQMSIICIFYNAVDYVVNLEFKLKILRWLFPCGRTTQHKSELKIVMDVSHYRSKKVNFFHHHILKRTLVFCYAILVNIL